MTTAELVKIQDLIYEIRGHRVMLDSALANLYGVETSNLNKAVKRNIQRFPEDFMFQLSKEEYNVLLFHFGISKKGRGGRRFMPYAFTEQGIAMLSSVLKSERAISVNIHIMRTFVKIKQFALENKEMSKRIENVEKFLSDYCKENDSDKHRIYEAINLLLDRTKPTKIGFNTK
jgi:hypothetical protein